MTSGDALLPPPTVAAAVIVELALASQPKGAAEGLDRLQAIGVSSGKLRPVEDRRPEWTVEGTGHWRTTDSGLMLGPDGAVTHFWSHLWVHSPAETLQSGFQTLVEAITNAIGDPNEDDRRSDGSRATWWRRPPVDVELYHHADGPESSAAAQIGITWSDLRPR